MKTILSVHQPFGGHKRGDLITDPKEMAAVKNGPNKLNVRKLIERPEHASGDFWRRDHELAAKAIVKAAPKAAPKAQRPAPVDALRE